MDVKHHARYLQGRANEDSEEEEREEEEEEGEEKRQDRVKGRKTVDREEGEEEWR